MKVKLLVDFVINDKKVKKGAIADLPDEEVKMLRIETGEVELLTEPEPKGDNQ
jgi:hypothetical protein